MEIEFEGARHAGKTAAMAEKVAQKKLEAIKPLLETFRQHMAAAHDTLEDIRSLVTADVSVADEMKRLQGVFMALWSGRYGNTKYDWKYATESPHLKRMLKGLGAVELEARMNRYMRNNDPFFTKTRHTFGIFITTINQHAVEAPTAAFALGSEDRPIGCRHAPPCVSEAACTSLRLREQRTTHQ